MSVLFIVLTCILCAAFAAAFIMVEHKQKYVPAVVLKGLASISFLATGYIASRISGGTGVEYTRLVLIGLMLGCIADVLLNLRFVFEKIGAKVFLVGIVVFLAGHVMYLVALLKKVKLWWAWILLGIIGAFFLIRWIFSKITAKPAFKIFGIFYLGAIMLMTCTAIGTVITAFSIGSLLFTIGSLSFLVSDIVLILNTFGKEQKFSLRITNLSFYYAAQLIIALSLLA